MDAINLNVLGYVYILESQCGQFVKVGRSKSPEKRLAALRRAANSNGRTWISPLQANSSLSERIAHRKLAAARQVGEWFEISFDAAVGLVSSCMTEPPTKDAIRAANDAREKSINDAVDFMLGVMLPPKLMNERRKEKPIFAEERATLMAVAQPALPLFH